MMMSIDCMRASNESLPERLGQVIGNIETQACVQQGLSAACSSELHALDHKLGPTNGSQRSTICPSTDRFSHSSQYTCFGISMRRKERVKNSDEYLPEEEQAIGKVQYPFQNITEDEIVFDLKIDLPLVSSSEDEGPCNVEEKRPFADISMNDSANIDKHSKYEFIQVSARLTENAENYTFNREKKRRVFQPQYYPGFTHNFSVAVLQKARQLTSKSHQVRVKAKGATFHEGFKDHAACSLRRVPQAYIDCCVAGSRW